MQDNKDKAVDCIACIEANNAENDNLRWMLMKKEADLAYAVSIARTLMEVLAMQRREIDILMNKNGALAPLWFKDVKKGLACTGH